MSPEPVITGPPDDMVNCLRNLAQARRELPLGHAIAGFHVEGPYIGAEDGPRGAHPLDDSVRPPDLAEYHRWQEATKVELSASPRFRRTGPARSTIYAPSRAMA